MVRCHFFLSVLLALTALGHAENQSGFISIDCGLPDNSSYTDKITGINYVTDAEYIDTGVSRTILPYYRSNDLEQQYLNLRTFPEGIKNCYTLTPPFVNGTKYLVRANFMYGNYDNKLAYPTFDLYLGVNYWDTVVIEDSSSSVTMEIFHAPSPSSNYIDVCLVNTSLGTPFISVLELRLVTDNIYVAPYGSLVLKERHDLRAYADRDIIRFGNDSFDRIWQPSFFTHDVTELNTSLDIDKNNFVVPYVVLSTAITMQNSSDNLTFRWQSDSATNFFLYFHFADFQNTQSREFNIFLNGKLWYGPFEPSYLSASTLHNILPMGPSTWFNFSFTKTFNSTLPPILNAIEIYELKELLNPQTYQQDVDSMKSIKAVYGVKRNWQGDPCSPQAFSWQGLNCFNDSITPPRIISLNLSSSELEGNISPFIFNLTMLKYLDLSNNSLTGEVPDFLSEMTSLTVLTLSGNNLTGSIPSKLMTKSANGSLRLSVEGNPNLCKKDPCESTPGKIEVVVEKKKNSNIIFPIVASVAAVLVLLIVLAVFWIFFIKRRKPQAQPQQGGGQVLSSRMTNIGLSKQESILEVKNRQIAYAEVQSMTNNFETVVGKGGFGTVYQGYFNGAQVAVKMLSPSSAQGYKEFRAEVKLLMRVHHRNLTFLVAYCDDSNNKALVYEYMVQGNLAEHLSKKSTNVLSWEERLRIGMDSAQGLEYLHNGCKPPIVHRDVKTTNILLNETFQAKISDFGLSRGIPTEGGDHKSTVVAGTPGYLDPEYYISNKLMEKSDVFSFGVVILEIITGRDVITRNHETPHIGKWTSNIVEKEGDIKKIIDSRLHGDFDVNSAWKAVEVAMACLSPTSARRPTMTEVVMELKECLDMELSRTNMNSRTSSNSIDMVALNIDHSEVTPFAR